MAYGLWLVASWLVISDWICWIYWIIWISVFPESPEYPDLPETKCMSLKPFFQSLQNIQTFQKTTP